jgi:hypothetical protein
VEYFVSLRDGSEKNQEPVKITISSFPDFGGIGLQIYELFLISQECFTLSHFKDLPIKKLSKTFKKGRYCEAGTLYFLPIFDRDHFGWMLYGCKS